MKIGSIKRYALINPIMPHYRYGVYKELSDRKDIQIDFFSDIKEMNGIKNLSFDFSKIEAGKGGLRWYRIKSHWYRFKKIFIVFWYSDLLKVITDKKYHGFIFTESSHSPAHWIFPLIARAYKKHVIFWGHGYYGNEGKLKSIFRIANIRLAHDFFLYGHAAERLLHEKGIKKENLQVVYNSLDYDSQLKYRTAITPEKINLKKIALFKKSGLPVILFIGRLEPNKKILMLLKSALEMREAGLDSNILVIGDGPEKDKLLRFKQENHLDNLLFYGKCYEESELALLIKLSDVSVSPGNVGLNCIHTLMYGTPIITHNNILSQMPEVEAIVPGFNGDLYEFGDQQDLTRKLSQWVYRKSEDTGIIENCYKMVDEKYNPKNQADILINTIKARFINE